MHIRRERVSYKVIINISYRFRCAVGAAWSFFKKVDAFVLAVEDATKIRPVTEWPVHRKSADAQDGLELIKQLERGT